MIGPQPRSTIYPTNTVPLIGLDTPDEPSTFDRLTKAHRFVTIARDESTDQDRRGRLTHIAMLIAVEMEELRP